MRSVGVVGGGQMGSGIAQLAAVHGLEVWLHDSDAGVLTGAHQSISSRIQRLVSKRILTKGKGAEAIRNLRCTSTLEDFCSVDIVIEAIVESEEVKKNLFAKLDKIVKSSAILASNTSSISITRLGSATNRPSQVIGIHFMNPPPIMKLVEIVRGANTSDKTFNTTKVLAESDIREIEPSRWQWALKVRLIRCYDLPPYGNNGPTLECIFHDREGSRIHATIKEGLLQKMKQILKEGHLFAIKNVIVADNRLKYKTTTHKYKLNFMNKTNVCEVLDDTFPSIMFEFKSFRDLKNADDVDENELFDVIGKIIARDPPQNKEINGRATKLIDFVIEDLEKNKLPCTVWGNFVDEIMAYLGTVGEEPVVVILQMCRARRFKNEVRVQSTFYVTKMIINGSLAEFLEFRNRMIYDSKTPTNSISTISVQSVPNIMEELSNAKAIFRTIEQVTENSEVGSFWVYARIVYVESHESWWYLSCKKCPKKMIVVGDKFYCEKCDNFDTIGNMRFKIHVRVVDSTGNAVFLLWDRESIELIGKTALELKTEMENQGTKSIEMPKDFEYLVDRKILFKVQVRSNQMHGFNGTYTVIKLTADPTTVENYCREFLDNQESDLFSKLNNTETRNEVLSSGDEVSTPIKSTDKGVEEKDVLNNSTLKRTLIDEFSTTAPDKKFKAIIKQEKD